MKAAAVTGLEAEARIARLAGLVARPSGAIATQTTAIAEALLREGAEALLSFGIAGALSPALRPGQLLLPRRVIDGRGARYPVDASLHSRARVALHRAGLIVEEEDILGAAVAAASPARKAELLGTTGAVGIDLESHLVAQAAWLARKPFLVLRAVADPSTRALPSTAVNGLTPDGKPAVGRVLLSLAIQPWQLPALLRLAGDTRRALDALGSALRVLSLAGEAQ